MVAQPNIHGVHARWSCHFQAGVQVQSLTLVVTEQGGVSAPEVAAAAAAAGSSSSGSSGSKAGTSSTGDSSSDSTSSTARGKAAAPADRQSSGGPGSPVGGIVGGAIGGIVAAFLLVLGACSAASTSFSNDAQLFCSTCDVRGLLRKLH